MSDLDRALAAARHALRTFDTDGGPFTDALPARLLLQEAAEHPLDAGVFEAVRHAALQEGHERAWLLPLRDAGAAPTHALPVDLADPRAYLDGARWPDGIARAHALVARDAAWAVVCDEEDDALLGGPPSLVEAVRAGLGDDEALRVRRWLRWRRRDPAGLLEHLGLVAGPAADPLGEALADEGELWLSAEPAHAGVVLSLARLGRPDRAFDRDAGLDRDVDPARLPEAARGAMRGTRPWFHVRVVGPDVVLRVGEGWVDVRVERTDVVPALQAAAAPARLVPLARYAPPVRAAMAAQLASLR